MKMVVSPVFVLVLTYIISIHAVYTIDIQQEKVGFHQGQATRLKLKGSNVFLPDAPDTPITLRGFNLDFKYGSDFALPIAEDFELGKLLPNTNLVRLVMNHWHDQLGKDCSTQDPPAFIRDECISQFDAILNWTTGPELPKAWSIITARSALAAGDGGPGNTIFDNTTLKTQWLAMWKTLAERYSGWDRIAGYEVIPLRLLVGLG